jgi:TetR/AcrR family transcriptional repressor of lmrAB and yxaGH operons
MTQLPTRERLVAAMAAALPRRGMNGIGLNELLASAQAPKGVLYHHFPGGKAALTVAAIEATVAQLLAGLDQLLARAPDPVAALQAWFGQAQKRLADGAFECGCPLATVALESTAADTAIRDALAAAFVAIRQRLADALRASGHAAASAEGLAALIVAAYEGALMQARVERSLRPVVLVTGTLVDLLETQRPPGGRR